MPGHLKQAAGAEADNEAPVRLGLDRLVGVEGETLGAGRGFRREAPDNIFDLVVIDIGAETAARVDADIEVSDRLERLRPQLRLDNILNPVVARNLVGPVEIAGDKVAADTEQKAVRRDLSPARRLVPHTSIENVDCPSALERGDKGLIDQLVRNRPWPRS